MLKNFPLFSPSVSFRLGLVNFLINVSIELSIIFLPLYAQNLGASNLEVGFIAAIYGLAFFISSFIFGRQSDIHGRLPFILIGLAVSAAGYLSQIFTPSSLLLLVVRSVIGFGLGIASAALTAYIFESQKQVGKFAAYGAFGWLCGALIAMAVTKYEILFIASAISSIIAFLVSLTFKEVPRIHVKISIFPVSIVKNNLRIYLPFFFRQIGAVAVWVIFPLFLTTLGASKMWVAVMDAINTITQVLLMRFVDRLNPGKVFGIGLLLTSIVFAIYGLAPNYLLILPVQIILGVSWSFMFVGALNYLFLHNPERGTSSGLLYSTIYLSNGLGPIVGGFVSQIWGYTTLMYVSCGLCLFSLLVYRGLNKTRS